MKTIIEKENKTPEVKIGDAKHQLIIEGVIIPENPDIFFDKLNNIVEETYTENKKLILDFKLEYFNTGAARFLYKTMLKLKSYESIEIVWRYEDDDEDILESGQEYETLTGLKFTYEII